MSESKEEAQHRMEEAVDSAVERYLSTDDAKEQPAESHEERDRWSPSAVQAALGAADRGAAADDPDEQELRSAIEDSLATIERSRVKMQSDQVEIDRLRTETRTMISRLLAA